MAYRLSEIIQQPYAGTITNNTYSANWSMGITSKNLYCGDLLNKKIIFEVSEKFLMIGINNKLSSTYSNAFIMFDPQYPRMYENGNYSTTEYWNGHTFIRTSYTGNRMLHILMDVKNKKIIAYDTVTQSVCFTAIFNRVIDKFFYLGFGVCDGSVNPLTINPDVASFQYQPQITYDTDLACIYDISTTYTYTTKKNDMLSIL